MSANTESFSLTVKRRMSAPPKALFGAWTEGFGRWFAIPDTVRMCAEVGEPFFFQTEFEGARYGHFGRFLKIVPNAEVEMTWVTTATLGEETIVRVRLTPEGEGTLLTLTHEGFPTEALKTRHAEAWPIVLAHQDEVTAFDGQPETP